jgi:DNA polymerase-3 subunit delta'
VTFRPRLFIFFPNGSPREPQARMTWSRVIEQERPVAALRRAVAGGRVAHAYLFHGPRGTGKRAAALAFAQALQCPHASDDDGDGRPCDECDACRKVRRLVHPDVHVLFPHPWSKEKDRDEHDLAERIQRLGENPYAAVDYVRRPSLEDPSETSNKQVLYRTGQVEQDLLRPMSLTRGEGRYKMALITEADRMNEKAANAFLKLLEEPPPRTVFVLTTARPSRLLPTITSRCQRLRFDPLPADAIAEALARRRDLPDERARMLARMADGSYGRALELLESDELMEHRRLVLDYFRQAYNQDPVKLASLTEDMRRLGREHVKELLGLMLRWVRDLLLVRTLGPEEAPLVNVDQAEAAKQFAQNLPRADLEAMTDLIEEARALVGRNVHLGLLLTALAQALGRAMQGRSARLYVPLPEAGLPHAA